MNEFDSDKLIIMDRANVKWKTSFMLPQHVLMLEELAESQKDVPLPNLDEQQIQEIEYMLQEAIHDRMPLHITYWDNKRLHSIFGYIVGISTVELRIKTDNGVKTIPTAKIINATKHN